MTACSQHSKWRLFRHGIAVGQWSTWSMSEPHLSRYVIAKVKFERLHYAYGYGYSRHIDNATASLKLAYVYYVYNHQRHLLTTTSLQIGIFPQLLCYSVYSKGAVLHSFVCCMAYACYTFQSQRNVKPASLV